MLKNSKLPEHILVNTPTLFAISSKNQVMVLAGIFNIESSLTMLKACILRERHDIRNNTCHAMFLSFPISCEHTSGTYFRNLRESDYHDFSCSQF